MRICPSADSHQKIKQSNLLSDQKTVGCGIAEVEGVEEAEEARGEFGERDPASSLRKIDAEMYEVEVEIQIELDGAEIAQTGESGDGRLSRDRP